MTDRTEANPISIRRRTPPQRVQYIAEKIRELHDKLRTGAPYGMDLISLAHALDVIAEDLEPENTTVTTPRIGDTVHYVPHIGPDHECLAALIFHTNQDGTETAVNVWTRGGDQYHAYPPADPGNGWEDFTPGTWHHIH